MNVSVREQVALKNPIFGCGEVCHSDTIIITILMWTVIPDSRFEKYSLPNFALKLIRFSYGTQESGENPVVNLHKNCLRNLQVYSQLVNAQSEQ